MLLLTLLIISGSIIILVDWFVILTDSPCEHRGDVIPNRRSNHEATDGPTTWLRQKIWNIINNNNNPVKEYRWYYWWCVFDAAAGWSAEDPSKYRHSARKPTGLRNKSTSKQTGESRTSTCTWLVLSVHLLFLLFVFEPSCCHLDDWAGAGGPQGLVNKDLSECSVVICCIMCWICHQ